MMMDSMGEAMASGADMTKPMEEMMNATLSAWGMSTPAGQSERTQQEEATGAAQAMAAQMAALNEKIAALEYQLSELNEESNES
jgi:ribulose 1,5-bisphosphate carboxylase large subunit-like protein